MESWWRHARRDMQFQLGPEGMKSDADCPFIDTATLGVEGEHWQFGSLRASIPFCHVIFQALCQTRSHRHISAFGEFRLPDEQQIACEIGIAHLQSRHFAYPQSQAIKQSENR